MTALHVLPDLDGWKQGGRGLWLPVDHTTPTPPSRPIGVGLFAGAGGFDLGFTQAGWHVAAALELDRDAAATYLINLGSPETVVHLPDGETAFCGDPRGFDGAGTGWIASEGHYGCQHFADGQHADLEHDGHGCFSCGWSPERCVCPRCLDPAPVEHFWMRDVCEVTGAEVLDALGLEQGEVGCVFGGPPCQGFSKAGKQDVMDPRNSLVFEFARLVLEIQPKTMVMENVPALLTMTTPEGVLVIDALARVLADGGFSTYDALRASLRASAGLGGVARPRTATRPASPPPDAEDALFALDDLAGAAR